MTLSIYGLHHVTAIASDPQRNLDFYIGLLGLRLVKRTVNFDDPGTNLLSPRGKVLENGMPGVQVHISAGNHDAIVPVSRNAAPGDLPPRRRCECGGVLRRRRP